MSISMEHARQLGLALCRPRSGHVYTWDDPGLVTALQLFSALGKWVPGASPILDGLRARGDQVSVTAPTPFGTVILLSRSAAGDPDVYAETIAHEAHHAQQVFAYSSWQMAVDYLGSGELRAAREAQAYVVGLWVRYLCTGVIPSIESAMSSLGSGLYHLDAGELELARGIVASGIQTMHEGLCPPYTVAIEAKVWIQKHAPEAHLVAMGGVQ